MSNKENIIKEFKGITGSDEILATNMLEACNWNLEMSVNMYLESGQEKLTSINSNNSEVDITASTTVRLANVCLYNFVVSKKQYKKFWNLGVKSLGNMRRRPYLAVF